MYPDSITIHYVFQATCVGSLFPFARLYTVRYICIECTNVHTRSRSSALFGMLCVQHGGRDSPIVSTGEISTIKAAVDVVASYKGLDLLIMKSGTMVFM